MQIFFYFESDEYWRVILDTIISLSLFHYETNHILLIPGSSEKTLHLVRLTFRNKCRVKEITPGPRRQQLLAEQCGPRPSSTSSALTLPWHTPMITDHTSCRSSSSNTLEEIHLSIPKKFSFAIAEEILFLTRLTNLNSLHCTLRLAHVCSPDQIGLKLWVSRLAGARQGYRYGRTKERSGGSFCDYGPRDIRPREAT